MSDFHLGSEGCKAPELVRMLVHFETERLYLVGDILDAWKYKIFHLRQIGRLFNRDKAWSLKLPQSHADVIQKILRHARRPETIVFWTPGNHDNFPRPNLPDFQNLNASDQQSYLEFLACGAEITQPNSRHAAIVASLNSVPYMGDIHTFTEIVHVTADGRRLLIRHGDEFDPLMRHQWLGVLGTRVRDQMYRTSELLSRNDEYWAIRLISRRLLGLSDDFSLADYIHRYKHKRDLDLPKIAAGYIAFKNQLLRDARHSDPSKVLEPELDGIIFGHSHIPSLSANGIICGNLGDWLNPEHCTTIIEHFDGRLELVRWNNQKGIVPYKEDVFPPIAPRTSLVTSFTHGPQPAHV